MELFNAFHLFSYLPVMGFGFILWYERMRRQGAQKRTTYLLLSLVALGLSGVVQAAATIFQSVLPFTWPQVFVLSGILYFLALIFLEYAIHVKRIQESFLSGDFHREVRGLGHWFGLAGLLALVVVVGAWSWQWPHNWFPLNLGLSMAAEQNPIRAYTEQMRLVVGLYSVLLIVAALLAAHRVFNLQEGVIRKRSYPFYAQILVTFVLLVSVWSEPPATSVATANILPVGWFSLLSLVYIVRLIEEFFFWSQFQLRSDRAKLEQRQHVQNLLIRRVIAGAEDDDQGIIRELMDASLEKVRGRMVVQEYRITGITVYRLVGNVFRVEDPSHLIGYVTPLADKSIKNLDKQKLNDQILRTTYDFQELKDTPADALKDFGKKLVQQAMTTKEMVVTSEVPEGLRGLQRLVVVVPILDADRVLGFLTAFKDSFDKLYPAERDVLGELAENLSTVYALMAGKEVQRERNRLQGEMNTARDIQTSILPRNAQVPGYQVATFMETATEVGGDVFDFILTPYGTYFGIGDVAGHGLPAGMMSVISVAALHGALDAAKSLGQALPLDQVYDAVNRVLCTLNRDRIGSDKFMTQNHFLAQGNRIEHVGTHMVAAVWRAGTQTIDELTDLTNKTGFLGLSEHMLSKDSLGSFTMAKDDVLVLYSDGVTEAKNANGTMFALDGIKRVLAEHASQTPQEFIQSLLESLRRHATTGDLKKHGGRFTDDISLVVLKKD